MKHILVFKLYMWLCLRFKEWLFFSLPVARHDCEISFVICISATVTLLRKEWGFIESSNGHRALYRFAKMRVLRWSQCFVHFPTLDRSVTEEPLKQKDKPLVKFLGTLNSLFSKFQLQLLLQYWTKSMNWLTQNVHFKLLLL